MVHHQRHLGQKPFHYSAVHIPRSSDHHDPSYAWRACGKGSKITRTVIIEDSRPDLITIGKNVWVTAGCQLLCHQRDLSQYKVGTPVMDLPLKYAPIVIKDGAHIGIGSIIMPGVTIGEGAVIGAGSVVTRDIPPHCVAVGAPAKVIKTFES